MGTECQLCIKLEASYTSTSSLVKHSELHRSTTGDKSKGAGKKFFDKCFPNVPFSEKRDSDGERKKIVFKKFSKKGTSKKFKMGDSKTLSTFNKNVSIKSYCRDVIESCPTAHIRCFICKKDVQTRYPNGFRRIDSVLNHVYIHAGTKMFLCRYCDDFRVFTPSNIKSHLSRNHKLPLRKDHYIDETGEHRGEMLEIIDQCFGSASDGPVKRFPGELAKKVNPKVIRRRRKRKSQSKKANLHCQQLLRRFGENGKIKCRVCSPKKFLLCRHSTNRSNNYDFQGAIDHAAIHLKKPLYICKLCTKSGTGCRPMALHINQQHRTSATDNYVNHSEKYEADVIRILSKCYDQDWEKRMKENQKSRMGLNTKKVVSKDEGVSAKKCQEEEEVQIIENENGQKLDDNGRNGNGQDVSKNVNEESGDVFCKCKHCLFRRNSKN